MGDFVIRDGVLINYAGSKNKCVLPNNILEIAAGAIRDVDKVIINPECKKLRCDAIYNYLEIEIPNNSKLSILEKEAIRAKRKEIKPVKLPDNIKVLNGFLPVIENIPESTQTIKKWAFLYNKGQIFYLGENIRKIEQDGLNTDSLYYTKAHQASDIGLEDQYGYYEDKIIFDVIDTKIKEFEGFKYLICKTDGETYASICDIPSKNSIIPNQIEGLIVKKVYFNVPDFQDTGYLIIVSDDVEHVSNLGLDGVTLLVNHPNQKLASNRSYQKAVDFNRVINGINLSDLKSSKDYLYTVKNNEAKIIRYQGEESISIVVPEQIDSFKVKEIHRDAFKNIHKTLAYLKIPVGCSMEPEHNSGVVIFDKYHIHKNCRNHDMFNSYDTDTEIIECFGEEGVDYFHIKQGSKEGLVAYQRTFYLKENKMTLKESIRGLKVIGVNCNFLCFSTNGISPNYPIDETIAKTFLRAFPLY